MCFVCLHRVVQGAEGCRAHRWVCACIFAVVRLCKCLLRTCLGTLQLQWRPGPRDSILCIHIYLLRSILFLASIGIGLRELDSAVNLTTIVLMTVVFSCWLGSYGHIQTNAFRALFFVFVLPRSRLSLWFDVVLWLLRNH